MTMRGSLPPAFLVAALLSGPAAASPAGAAQPDPLGSSNWDVVRDAVFGTAPVQFDDQHVTLDVPPKVEDGGQVPVWVAAHGLADVREIVVLADLNPAPRAVTYHPLAAEPRLGLRIKVDQATVIHAGVLTGDGVWHVTGVKVDAPGGGCTTPSASQSAQSWKTRLNMPQGEVWRRPEGGDRLRLRIVHPMNTGFVSGIPAFFIDHLVVKAADDGRVVAEMMPAEPMAENPTLTIDLTAAGRSAAGYRVEWSDTDGNKGSATLPPAHQSLAAEADR